MSNANLAYRRRLYVLGNLLVERVVKYKTVQQEVANDETDRTRMLLRRETLASRHFSDCIIFLSSTYQEMLLIVRNLHVDQSASVEQVFGLCEYLSDRLEKFEACENFVMAQYIAFWSTVAGLENSTPMMIDISKWYRCINISDVCDCIVLLYQKAMDLYSEQSLDSEHVSSTFNDISKEVYESLSVQHLQLTRISADCKQRHEQWVSRCQCFALGRVNTHCTCDISTYSAPREYKVIDINNIIGRMNSS
jgi:hypothetical protein